MTAKFLDPVVQQASGSEGCIRKVTAFVTRSGVVICTALTSSRNAQPQRMLMDTVASNLNAQHCLQLMSVETACWLNQQQATKSTLQQVGKGVRLRLARWRPLLHRPHAARHANALLPCSRRCFAGSLVLRQPAASSRLLILLLLLLVVLLLLAGMRLLRCRVAPVQAIQQVMAVRGAAIPIAQQVATSLHASQLPHEAGSRYKVKQLRIAWRTAITLSTRSTPYFADKDTEHASTTQHRLIHRYMPMIDMQSTCLLRLGAAAHEIIQAGHRMRGRLLRLRPTAYVQPLQICQQVACTPAIY